MALIVEIPTPGLQPDLNGGSGYCFIEEEVGTPEATALGLIVGEDTFTDPALINRCIEVHRNNIILPSKPWKGGQYFTKEFAMSFFIFSHPLGDEELIKIKLL